MSSTDPSTSPVGALSDRFWEEILDLNPTTASVYGDERYADRLEDPSPAGRRRPASSRSARSATPRRSRPTASRSRTGSPATCSIVIADLAIEEDDQGTHRLAVVDQIGGPQTLLPQICQFQKADTPERLEKFIARLERLPGRTWTRTSGILREGIETRPDRAPDRRRADRPAARAAARDPDRGGDRPVDGPGRVGRRPRERPRGRPRRRLPGRRSFLDALRGDYLAATREEPGLWSAPDGDALYRTQIRAWTTLDLDPQDGPRDRHGGARGDRDGRREIARRRASATTRRRIARRSPPTPPTSRTRRTS